MQVKLIALYLWIQVKKAVVLEPEQQSLIFFHLLLHKRSGRIQPSVNCQHGITHTKSSNAVVMILSRMQLKTTYLKKKTKQTKRRKKQKNKSLTHPWLILALSSSACGLYIFAKDSGEVTGWLTARMPGFPSDKALSPNQAEVGDRGLPS